MLNDDIHSIRDRVNGGNFRLYHSLQTNNRIDLCAAMDIVDDTELALLSFKPVENLIDGQKYLRFYGAIECLHAQKDALQRIAEIFEIGKFTFPKEIIEVICIRNHAFAHPYQQNDKDKDKKKFKKTTTIVRSSMTSTTFELSEYCFNQDGSKIENRKEIDMMKVIEQHMSVLHIVYNSIGNKMDQLENEHRANFRSDKLQNIFETVAYFCSKLNETQEEHHLKSIKDVANTLELKLKERDEIEWLKGIQHEIEFYNNACSELERLYQSEQEDDVVIKILANFIFLKFSELHQEAKNIDAKYAVDILHSQPNP
jgi:hypothetical protein